MAVANSINYPISKRLEKSNVLEKNPRFVSSGLKNILNDVFIPGFILISFSDARMF